MKLSTTLFSALALASTASAQILTADDFSYTGDLTANGWAAHSGAGAKVVMSDGNVVTLDFSSGSGEDVNMPIPTRADTAITYASFTLNVPSGNPVNPDNNGSYFAHFKDDGFAFCARTGLLTPAAAGDFGLGINATASSIGSGAIWANDLMFDTDYTIVVSYDAATGESLLWVDPASQASTSISHVGTPGTGLTQWAWRQSNDHTGFIKVDNLVVGGSFDDVTTSDAANVFIRANSSLGCAGLPLHYTSAVSPADPSQPATWAGGTNAVLTVEGMDPSLNIGLLIFGYGPFGAPLFGGTVVPTPDILEIVIGFGGTAEVVVPIPNGISGAMFWTQFATLDTCVPSTDFGFSNGQSHLLP